MSVATGPVRVPNWAGVPRQMRDARAPDLVLAGHAGDGGAGAPDPAALHDGVPLARAGQMPGEQLAALAAAEDQGVEALGS